MNSSVIKTDCMGHIQYTSLLIKSSFELTYDVNLFFVGFFLFCLKVYMGQVTHSEGFIFWRRRDTFNPLRMLILFTIYHHPSVQRIQREYGNSTQTVEIKPVTQGQVLAALESLNTNKATGSDGIPPRALKIGAQQLCKPLNILFNSCLSNCVWPSVWKRGDWTPVYKKEDKLSKENYRPITILPCVNKILEKLVGSQIAAGFDVPHV